MARILGLDLGAGSIKAVLLESSLRRLSVSARGEFPRDGELDFTALAAGLKASGMAHADQIIVSVPGTSVATQHLNLPFADARRIEATLGFEVEAALPYDIAETAWDHQVLSVNEGKSEILVGCAPSGEVAGLLDGLKTAGLDPRVVTSSALAFQNLFSASGKRKGGADADAAQPQAILDIGMERTSLCVCQPGGNLLCARTFPGGGRDLTRAIAAAFDVSLEDAEAWKKTEGSLLPPADGAAEDAGAVKARGALAKALSPIVREIRATLRASEVRFHISPSKIHLAGGTSYLLGISQFLTEQLGIEVMPLELPGTEELGLVGDGRHFALAVSLALQGAGGLRGHRFNLRKGALAFKGDMDFLKGKTSRIGIFALVLAVLAGTAMGLEWSNVKKREKAIDDELFAMTKKVFGQGQRNYDVALNMLKGNSTAGTQLPTVSAVDIFGFLVDGAQKADVKLEETKAELERVSLRGETGGFDGVDRLVSQLEAVPCFREVKRNKVQKSRDGSKIIFELDVRVACGGDKDKASGSSRGR